MSVELLALRDAGSNVAAELNTGRKPERDNEGDVMARAGAALIGGNFIECGTLTAGPSVTDLDTSRLADCITMPLQRLALIDGSPGSVPPPGG